MTNPTKNQMGDGVHIAEDIIQGVGEIPMRAANGAITAVPAGTVGQVPTYQADGTLAPADGGGGGGSSVAEQAFGVNNGPTIPLLEGFGDVYTVPFDSVQSSTNVTVNVNGTVSVTAGVYLVTAVVFPGASGFSVADGLGFDVMSSELALAGTPVILPGEDGGPYISASGVFATATSGSVWCRFRAYASTSGSVGRTTLKVVRLGDFV